MGSDGFVSVKEYFQKGRFIVPCYQRGYKWSILSSSYDKTRTHLELLLHNLVESFKNSPDEDFHLQGVTVKIGEDGIELVDGQQRTTSLYLLLLYAYTHGAKEFEDLLFVNNDSLQYRLDYRVRGKVKGWITARFDNDKSSINNELFKDEDVQDLAAFNAAWNTINECFERLCIRKNDSGQSSEDSAVITKFIEYVLDKVKLIYVVLETEPTKVFSMMNKDKAIMKRTELVKSKLLSEASRQAFADLDTGEEGSHEWQINHLRGHFAREWDSWLKWWNISEHYKFYNKWISKVKVEEGSVGIKVEEPEMSCLLKLYWEKKHPCQKFKECFCKLISDDKEQCPQSDTASNCNHKFKKDTKLSTSNLLSQYECFICNQDGLTGDKRIEAVETFEGLRDLHRTLVEWYDDPEIYNWLGLIFYSTDGAKDTVLINLLLDHDCKIEKIKKLYIDKSFESMKEDWEWIKKGRQETEEPADAFHDHYVFVARQFLRRNVTDLNKFKLKFDFSMYHEESDNRDKRSIEHIHAQNDFLDEDKLSATIPATAQIHDNLASATHENMEKSTANKGEKISRPLGNSIGNLALLPKGLNSKIGINPYEVKKKMVFDAFSSEDKDDRKMALFLHTLKMFSKKTWNEDDIRANHAEFCNEFIKFYNLEGK